MSAARTLATLPTWLARLVRALPLLIGASILTLVLDGAGALRKLERAALDFQASVAQGTSPSPVALVLISEEDYRTRFGGRSPLDPAALRNLLDAIAATAPKAIVVGVDTSDRAFAALPAPAAGPPVIWARPADYSRRRKLFLAKPFLGGAHPRLPAGLTAQEVDSDGVIRRYQHLHRTDRGMLPSLAWAAVCAVQGRSPIGSVDRRNDFFLRFGLARRRLQPTAGAVLEMARAPEWRSGSVLTDKVVVIGGEYSVDDEHETPAGWRLGSEVVAQAIETELAGGGRRITPLPLPVLLLLQVTQGVLLLLVFQTVRFRTALGVSLLLIPGLASAFSLFAYGSLSHWGQFAPILVVVVAMQVAERARKARTGLLDSAAGRLKPGPRRDRSHQERAVRRSSRRGR